MSNNCDELEKLFTDYLKIETLSKPIYSLFSDSYKQKINYKPYYQRNYVWDPEKASYFIESILLGTEIPPLIFFKHYDGKIEVIDGRQRWETIDRFMNNKFSLKKLSALKGFDKFNYDKIRSELEDKKMEDLFLATKIRIFQFEMTRESSQDLEEKIKREIFARYNSGITPLKRYEINNAVKDKDDIHNHFKKILDDNQVFLGWMQDLFFNPNKKPNSLQILEFIENQMVLKQYSIKHYSWPSSRTKTLNKLFEILSNQTEQEAVQSLCLSFIQKVKIVDSLKISFIKKNLSYHRLMFECLLWGLLVIEEEKCDLSKLEDPAFLDKLSEELSENIDKYKDNPSKFPYEQIQERYNFTAEILKKEFAIDFDLYLGSKEKRDELKNSRNIEGEDTVTKLSELESLRVTKPDPSSISIEDIASMMKRSKFLVRPSYQRSEVINLSKASAIIESILLGIKLPPLFIFKRTDGISEVIDGQQRILTILGFTGKPYVDESGKLDRPNTDNFKLKGLRILKNINNHKFTELNENLQSKIIDFNLLVVEIKESENPEFDPVDLFVRLNNKPYPIKEDSFEMWNSWVDSKVIEKIKEIYKKYGTWFNLKKPSDRDRMENEELYTSLVYLDYPEKKDRPLTLWQNNNTMNVKIGFKKDMTDELKKVSNDPEKKQSFLESINNLEQFISQVEVVLSDCDVEEDQPPSDLNAALNCLYQPGKKPRSAKRTKQDFYMLWYVLNPIDSEMVKSHRRDIKNDLQAIFEKRKNTSETLQDGSSYETIFKGLVETFHQRYKQAEAPLDEIEEAMSQNQETGTIAPLGTL
jgi:uncharacterized protein with ParB-like and HNH nuclease domain